MESAPLPQGLKMSTVGFDIDEMLGKLAKWLRIIGLDAAYPCPNPTAGRVFVTSKRDVAFSPVVRITQTRPRYQLAEFLEKSGIHPDPQGFMSRCLVCNIPVHSVSKDEVKTRVPPAVLESMSAFNRCPACDRIYWMGSHIERVRKRLEEIRVPGHDR